MPKRIVICSDGTWNDPEKPNPTNVLRVARAIMPEASDGMGQVVFYDWGVGTYHDKIAGGAFGVGLEKNVQDGYRFIVQNYDPKDEIVLFGFSRGAYTARCLAGMLNNCGVLRSEHAAQIPRAFDLYKSQSAPPHSKRAKTFRGKYAYGTQRGAVRFIGVWDTVGALGIPTRALSFVNNADLFYDQEIGTNVHTARHAVSIDELRSDFEPTLWKPKEAVDIRQVWFAGVHSDIGGGYAPTRGKLASDIPLHWMAREATAAGLRLKPHLVQASALDPHAALHESDNVFYKMRDFYTLRGSRRRQIPPDAIVHDSVRKRYEAGAYNSGALEAWLADKEGYWGELET